MAVINKTVLMSGVDYFNTAQAINPYMSSSASVDIEKARQEHVAVQEALQDAGVKVITVQPPEGCQDGVYTANWALIRGNKALMARLPNARKGEEAYAATVLNDLGKEIIFVPDELRFSGQGDALPCGDYLFMGSQYRTDQETHQFVANTMGFNVISLQTIPDTNLFGKPRINRASGWPDSFFYDIDLALSVIKPSVACTHEAQVLSDGEISSREADRAVSKYGEGSITEKNLANAKKASRVTGSANEQASCPECRGLIAWCPQAFTKDSQAIIRDLPIDKIEVSLEEAKKGFACNLVSTGEIVIMSNKAPQLKAAIESKGLKTVTPDITELAKGGGYIRCTTLTLDNI